MEFAAMRGDSTMNRSMGARRLQLLPPAWLALGLCMAASSLASEPLDAACLDCHRTDRHGAAPIIEGQHFEYLRAQLLRFAERHREGFPMNALAAGLDGQRVETLARALAAREWPSSAAGMTADAGTSAEDQTDAAGAAAPVPTAPAPIERAQLAALDCAACHGADYRGGGEIPRLAGQRVVYLQRQIEGFGESQRHHPPVAGGARMYMIDAAEAEAIARALAALE
jgi:cytochrome c553